MGSKLSFFRSAILIWLFVSLAGQSLCNFPFVSMIAASSPPAQGPANLEPQETRPIRRQQTEEEPAPALSDRQKRSILRSNFEKMKHDVDELADLTKQLQGELDKSNENILSLTVIDKADRIEKLAKKIKASAHGS